MCLVTVATLANGGPWEWTQVTLRGGPKPATPNPVRLKSETLSIRMEDDGRHYRVAAEYHLTNPGATTRVRYVIPLFWAWEPDSTEKPEQTIQKYLGDLKLAQDGRPVGCKPMSDAAKSEGGGDWVEYRSGNCEGLLNFKHGAESVVRLEYRGELEYEDSGTSKSALPYFGQRTLRYALFPAGYWAGPAQRVSIEVEMGRFASRTTLKTPSELKWEGTKAVWSQMNVDLKKFPWLELSFKADDLLRGDFLLHYNRDCKEEWFCFNLDATPSSALRLPPSADHSAALLTDGKAETAWCAARDDRQPHIRLRVKDFRGKVREQCRVEGLAIVPGYAKSQRVWMNNQRINRLYVTRCDAKLPVRYGDQPSIDIPIENMTAETPVFYFGGLEIPGEPATRVHITDLLPEEGDPCLQLVLDHHSPELDLCISEIALIFNCG